MTTVKRISDSYSIVGTGGNTVVSIGNISLSPANLTINGNLTVTGTSNTNLPSYSVGSLPTVVLGSLIYVNDADSGNGRVAFGNATAWIDMTTGNVVV